MSLFEALWLAMLQGFSELFPISSLGHTVVIPALVGWRVDQRSPAFLPFVVTLHLGTAAALLTFFWRDWLGLIGALLRSVVRGKLSADPDERLAWLIVLGTVPAGLLGFFLEKPLRALFAAPAIAAAFLMVNGLIMFAGERLRRRGEHEPLTAEEGAGLEKLTPRSAIGIGLAQAAALVPGISRSGATMVAGLLFGLRHEPAARFSFLLATPIILAAGLLEVPVLFGSQGRGTLGLALIGGVAAAITAWLSVKFLMRYFTFGRLDPFAYYCWAFGALSLAFILLRSP
jgi:undecaprenyl-diphosphatase